MKWSKWACNLCIVLKKSKCYVLSRVNMERLSYIYYMVNLADALGNKYITIELSYVVNCG